MSNNPHIRKILYKSNYNINEATIRKITEADFENDDMPEDVIPLSNQEVDTNKNVDEPTQNVEQQPSVSEPVINQPTQTQPIDQSVDSMQNNLLKMNLSAMIKMHDEMDRLNKTVEQLNIQNAKLKADVEEVREPSNEEKLLRRKNDSFPYYNNLNDIWKDNWFQQNTINNEYEGIKKLDDGTYIANFDDLPKYNNISNTFS